MITPRMVRMEGVKTPANAPNLRGALNVLKVSLRIYRKGRRECQKRDKDHHQNIGSRYIEHFEIFAWNVKTYAGFILKLHEQ